MSEAWGFNWSAYIDALRQNPWSFGAKALEFLSSFIPLSFIVSVVMGVYAWVLYVNTRSALVAGIGLFLAGLAMGAQNVIPELQILGVIFAVVGAGMSVYDVVRK